LQETLLNPTLLIFWGVVAVLGVGAVAWVVLNRHKLKRLKKKMHADAVAKAKALEEKADAAGVQSARFAASKAGGAEAGDSVRGGLAKSGGIRGAFKKITDKYKEASKKVQVNKDGSVTFFQENIEPMAPKTTTVIKDSDTGVAQIREITTTVISTVAITETKITVRPSNMLFKAATTWQAESVKVKSLVSFSQISGKVDPNTKLSHAPCLFE
jgi:hypothetical protein